MKSRTTVCKNKSYNIKVETLVAVYQPPLLLPVTGVHDLPLVWPNVFLGKFEA